MPSVIPVVVETPTVAPPSLKETKAANEAKSAIPTFPPFQYADIFNSDKQYGDFRDDIVKKGYAVIPALSVERALSLRDQAHSWVEGFERGYKRDDPSTFTVEKLPVSVKGGMYHGYGIAHESWVWETRTDPAVLDAFTKVFGTNELITSFDGASVMLPGQKAADLGRWPHIDQNPFREGFFCLQGIVNLNYNGPDDGGLLVLEGSHQLMRQHFTETGRTETRSWGPLDWAGFEPEEEEWFFEKGCEWKKVTAQPGDLILWDSRAMHCNEPPKGKVDRVNTYVCMAPAHLVSDEDRQRRIQAFNTWGGTTHAPFKDIFLRAHEPKVRTETGLADPLDTGVPRNPVNVKDEAVLKLVGALPY